MQRDLKSLYIYFYIKQVIKISKRDELIKTTCGDCGKEIFIKYDTYRTTKNRDTHIWRCNECLYKYRSNLKKKQEAELSEEERERRNKLRSMSLKKYNAEHMTKEDWDNRVAKAKDTIAK